MGKEQGDGRRELRLRGAVGEIDTRAPFTSVRAAVSLFGKTVTKGSSASKLPKSQQPVENLLAEETQHDLAQKELNMLKEQLHDAEITRIHALTDLDSAKKIVEVLSHELKNINESKEQALEVTEVAKGKTKQLEEVSSSQKTEKDDTWKQELQSAREHYAAAITELDAAKQELRRVRKDFDASMDAKISSFQQETDCKQLSIANEEKANQLLKEIAIVQESLVHVKLATEQAQQEETKIRYEKDTRWQSYRLALEEYEGKMAALKKDFDPELNMSLETKLTEVTAEIGTVQMEVEEAMITKDLVGAKVVLREVAADENSLKTQVESLSVELEAVKKEHFILKEKDADAESGSVNLRGQLMKLKSDLEAALVAEAKAGAESIDIASSLQQLSAETEAALLEAEALKKKAEELRHEAEAARAVLAESEKKLQVALCDAEEAKAAEAGSLSKVKEISERADACRSSVSEYSAKITISTEEYISLSRKAEDSEKLAEMKVGAAMAQVEAVRSGENETLKRLEATRVEVENLAAATEEALKRAEMADAAKKAVEGELKRWFEKEQQVTTETEFEMKVSEEESSPIAKIPMANTIETSDAQKKIYRASSTKRSLLPSLSGIFQRKKNHID